MLEYGFSLTHIFPYKDRIWKNTIQWNPVFSHILVEQTLALTSRKYVAKQGINLPKFSKKHFNS